MSDLTQAIKEIGLRLGFNQIRMTDTNLQAYEAYYRQWVARGFHAGMHYMVKHGDKRLDPCALYPETRSIIVVSLNYLPPSKPKWVRRESPEIGVIARYAFGKDYHYVLRDKLKLFVEEIKKLKEAQNMAGRLFVDSAPILEKPLAEKAGIGWQGKNGLIIHPQEGSWFFLGVILTNLELTFDEPMTPSCGACKACLKICPTQAIVAPKIINSKRCIAYLTIEYQGIIDENLRPLIGQRIFGCDDCQAVCPWNRYASPTPEKAFWDSKGITAPDLLTLYSFNEEEYQRLFSESPLGRCGYAGWLRNVAIAIGNAPYNNKYLQLLKDRSVSSNPVIADHAHWALRQQISKEPT